MTSRHPTGDTARPEPGARPEPEAAAARLGTFRSFRYPNYRIFAAGTLVSGVGSWGQRVAQDWLVLQISGRAADVGMVIALQFLSIMLFSPLAGVLVDRFPKRSLIIWSNVAMAVSASGLAALDSAGRVQVWHVYLLGFVLGGLTALETPARQAFASEMVRRVDLTNALSLSNSIMQSARLIGPALAGVLIAVSGTPLVFWLNGASYLAVVVSMAMMNADLLKPTQRPARHEGGVGTALRYLRTRRDLLLLLLIIGASGIFSLNLQLTITLMATSEFGLKADGFGILISVLAIGSVGGGLIGARIADPTPRLVAGVGVLFGLCGILYASMPNAVLYGITLVPMGALLLLLVVTCSGCFQLRCPPTARGRLVALFYTVMMGCNGIGALVIGHAADFFGLRMTVGGGGAGTGLVCAGVWWVLRAAPAGAGSEPDQGDILGGAPLRPQPKQPRRRRRGASDAVTALPAVLDSAAKL